MRNNSKEDEWEPFRSFEKLIPAQLLTDKLIAGGVPCEIHTASLDNALVGEYMVVVPKSLAHRARWIVSQVPVTDKELEFLATGDLPGSESN